MESGSGGEKDLIVLKLNGGLGNQMFQYACGRAVSIKKEVPLFVDCTSFPDKNGRKYSLDGFNVKVDVADKQLLNKFKGSLTAGFFKKMGINIHSQYECYFEKELFVFNPEIFEMGDNLHLDGYWQNEKYFKDIKNTLYEDFTLRSILSKKGILIKERIEKSNAVALHIRRGDYVSNSETNRVHGALGLNYYEKAIDIISKKIDSPHFFVFSDDIVWAENNIKSPFPIEFIKDHECSDVEELFLMSRCKHQIIANSSFSWWGAWLNKNTEKTIVAPHKWFNDFDADTKDLIPDEWIKI